MKLATFALSLMLLVPFAGRATSFMTQQEALESAFPKGTKIERQSHFLTDPQVAQVKRAGVSDASALVVRYVGKANGQIVGYVYFDAHRVRTLPETLMVVVSPAGTVERVDILNFKEPLDYLPKRRWLDQLRGRKLDAELSLKKAIRPISGATLSGRAVVDATRKLLAIHQVLASPGTAVAQKGR